MNTRLLQLGCELVHVGQFSTPTVLMIQPGSDVEVVRQQWVTDPSMVTHDYTDSFGNRVKRLVLPAGESLLAYYAVVRIPDALDEADEDAPEVSPEFLPDQLLVFTLPSRYCQSDQLSAQAWQLFGQLKPGYGRVRAIQEFVWKHLDYRTGSTASWWTAADSYNSGYGVCRDFAHLMVSFCRALNIPARYVSGYLPDLEVEPIPTPMDFHAWVEVWLGDRWYTFDPRHNQRRKGHVPICRGRDAADVALVTTYGAPWLKRMTVWADDLPPDVEWPPSDVSLQERDPFR
ncbi:MAG: transglutaminase family protein [Micropruina sp.]